MKQANALDDLKEIYFPFISFLLSQVLELSVFS